MRHLTAQSRIVRAVEPIDGRKGREGLAAVGRQVVGDTPLGGAV